MSENKEPPPLFDDDGDLFASAVESPFNENHDFTNSHPLLAEPIAIPTPAPIEPVKEEPETIPPPTIAAAEEDLFESCIPSAFDNVDLKNVSLDDDAVPEQVRDESDDILVDIGVTTTQKAIPEDPFTTQFDFASNSLHEVVTNADTFCSPKPHFLSDFESTEISLDDSAQENGPSPAVLTTQSAPFSEPSNTAGIPSFNSGPSPSTPEVSSSRPLVSSSSVLSDKSDKEVSDDFIEISISDPQKIGDGMGSYMAYKVTTKTNISFFRKKHWSVTRRFSDFLGLHSKLVEKHLHSGVIIPPAPEKDAFASTKIKLGSDKSTDPSFGDFIERRRAALERYMNRTGAHVKLRADPDFREFLELDADLPKATSTSAISGAGVLRLFNRVGETVNKMTFKMDESDQWYEEKTQHIENLDAQLRKLHLAMENLVNYRRELAISTSNFSKSAAVLSSVEEHTSLSRALNQLSEATEKVHSIHHAQADADFFHLSETTKDYINLIGAVKDVFHERVKSFQTWQHAEATLAKKRENKARSELTGRHDKVDQANEEVREWESKVERGKEEFDRISKAIKVEMEQFDIKRLEDFKDMFVKYLEVLLTSQIQIVKVWETFLPEAKAIV